MTTRYYRKHCWPVCLALNNRETALEHFRRLKAHLSLREVNGRRVLGIQLRNRDASDADLRHLYVLRDELDVIGLEGTRITDEGLNHLRGLPMLDNVDLTNTSISDAGLEILAKIESLEYIHLASTAVTAEGVARLENALPKCEVVWDGT